ncbi:GntR family transcriptional regulator [Mesorhizobium sp. VNQ89]|uniref:GntR family transcriptional regulator n=1 Tax=Mesorhizobium quangtriensis TaxID=3157709 RepID=UPI0032B851B3
MSRLSHRDRIYDLLIEQIRTGSIGWDDRLVDVSLAAALGVSRMPARDALMRLVAEGYLVPTTRGFVLPKLTREEVLEVFELRRLLEPRAAAMAAMAMTDDIVAIMEAAVERAAKAVGAGDGTTLFHASETFRNSWLSVVPNTALVQTIRRYFVQVQNVRLITMNDESTLSVIVAGQRDLLAAHRARDAVAAGDRMLRFVIEGEQAFRKAIDT